MELLNAKYREHFDGFENWWTTNKPAIFH